MQECQHLNNCEFVLRYVAQVKPHWDDFVSLYCCGDFQENCQRFEHFKAHGMLPASALMPTGQRVPQNLEKE